MAGVGPRACAVPSGMNETEKQIWIISFAARQPQPKSGNPQYSGGKDAKYWAAAAVFVFRGEKENPTDEHVNQLFVEAGGRVQSG